MKHAPLFLALVAIFAPPTSAAPAATVLFAQTGSEIIGADGKVRPAVQGDVLATGERLTTRENAISQLLLTDGSLISMRPASEVKIDTPAAPSLPGATPNSGDTLQMISLVQGAVRVIGSELMDKQKPSSITLQTGQATVRLNAADLESAIVRPDAAKSNVSNEAGSYNRLQVGSGSIQSGAAREALAPRQVSFVGSGSTAPVTVTSVPSKVFASIAVPDRVAAAGSAGTSSARAPSSDLLPPTATRTASVSPATSRLLPTTLAAINPAVVSPPADAPVISRSGVSPSLGVLAPPIATRAAPTPIAPIVNTPTPIAPIVNIPTAVAPIVNTPIAVAPIVNTTLAIAPIVNMTLIAPITTVKTPTITVAPTIIQPKVTCTPVVIAGVKKCI